jgi:ABC-type polysaccharide/polyol phosphate export permease
MTFFVCCIAFVYSFVFGAEIREFLPWVACGFFGWNFIANSLAEGCNVFIANRENILNLNCNHQQYALRLCFKLLIVTLHQAVFLLPFYAFFPEYLTLNVFMLPLSIALYTYNSFLVILTLGILTLKFRDLQNIVMNISLLFFLITPIFWPIGITGRVFFIEMNPVFHFIQLVRAPILGGLPDLRNVLAVLLSTAVLTIVAFLIERKNGKNLYSMI